MAEQELDVPYRALTSRKTIKTMNLEPAGVGDLREKHSE
jgi:hypothetical protein